MLLPEPTYQGPENIVYFRANGLEEELQRDPHVTWLVAFFAPWSPSCVSFTPIFAKLSAKYNLPNLKFGNYDNGETCFREKDVAPNLCNLKVKVANHES